MAGDRFPGWVQIKFKILINMFKFFKPKQVTQIVISFTVDTDGTVKSKIVMDGNVPVAKAIEAIDSLRNNMVFGMNARVRTSGYGKRDNRLPKFIKTLKLGDVMKGNANG